MKKVDTLERATTEASKTSQQYEAQLLGLQRQLKEAHVMTRLAESNLDKVRRRPPCSCTLTVQVLQVEIHC